MAIGLVARNLTHLASCSDSDVGKMAVLIDWFESQNLCIAAIHWYDNKEK